MYPDFLDSFQEFLKSTVDLADLVGLHFVMNKLGKGHLKFLISGMGWATSELIMTKLVFRHLFVELFDLFFCRFLPLWVGARGIEFDWKYMQMGFDSNISLVCIFLFSTSLLVS
jgi:hypothetical protein